jgi:hypothetical protein
VRLATSFEEKVLPSWIRAWILSYPRKALAGTEQPEEWQPLQGGRGFRRRARGV